MICMSIDNYDSDDFSSSNTLFSPWNFKEKFNTYFLTSSNSSLFYILKSSDTGFTFNPVIMRFNFYLQSLKYTNEEQIKDLPIERSGERDLDKWVRSLPSLAGVLKDGAFSHIGSPGIRPIFIYIPIKIINAFIRIVISLIRK